jgi:hypothetical protein
MRWSRRLDRIWILILAVFLAAGCSDTARVTALPGEVHRITVLPPLNHGSPTVVAPEPVSQMFYRKAPQRPATFSDYLARELESELALRGYSVTHPSTVELATHGRPPDNAEAAASLARSANLPGPVLFTDITECDAEPEGRKIVFSVGADASLVDPQTAEVVWQVHSPAREVTLRDEGGRARASREVAIWLARALLASVKPVPGARARR